MSTRRLPRVQLSSRFPTLSRFIIVLIWTIVAIGVTFMLSATANAQLAGGAAIAIVVLGLSFLTGWSGQVSLGNSAFMLVGAYTASIWANHHTTTPLIVTFALATLAGGATGLILGIPSTRLRGPYLAGMTLAFAYALPQVVVNFPNWTGGTGGLFMNTLTAPQWFVDMVGGQYASLDAPQHWEAVIAILVAAVAFFFMSNLFRSRTGRAMRLVRDNDVAAELVGINLPRTRTLAFVVSAAYGGLGGALLAIINGGSNAQLTYPVALSIFLLTYMVLGGIGTLSGAVIAGLFYAYSDTLINKVESITGISQSSNFGSQMKGIVLGVLLILTMLLAPAGLAGLGPKIKQLVQRMRSSPPSEPAALTPVDNSATAPSTDQASPAE